MRNIFVSIILLSALLLISGCGAPSTQQTAAEQAAIANVRSNQAVVTRRTGFQGGAFPVIITLNGVQVASIPMNQTKTFNVPAGRNTLRATSGLMAPAQLTFTKQETDPVFFNVSLRVGIIGGSLELTQVIKN